MTKTMLGRLIEAATKAPRAVGHRQHMENVIDAILAELREPDEGMYAAACATMSDDPETILAAMIDHVREGG